MESLDNYINAIHPKNFRKTMKDLVKKDDSTTTFVNVIIGMIFGTISTILGILGMSQADYEQMQTSLAGSGYEHLVDWMIASSSPVGLAISFVTGVILFYIVTGLLFYIAKLLGGNGKLGNQLYLFSVLMVSFSIFGVFLQILSIVPYADCIAGLVSLALFVYMIYIYYNALRITHPKISKINAILAYILWGVVYVALSLGYMLTRLTLGI